LARSTSGRPAAGSSTSTAFIGGETNQWYPAIYEGTTPIEPEKTPEEGYHFTEGMTNKAIKWARQQKPLVPDRPFFMYFAPRRLPRPAPCPAGVGRQIIEMLCNRGVYHKGWTAVTRHGVAWVGAYKRSFDEDVWELYDTNTDWTQARDLAKEHPTKLSELQRLFLIEAAKYSVLPLDDRTFERFNPDTAGRPQLIKGKTQVLFGGMGRLTENSILSIKNKSYSTISTCRNRAPRA